MKKIIILICVALFATPLCSQDIMLQNAEQELSSLMNVMFSSKDDNERFNANEKFLTLLDNVLEYPNSFDYPFENLDKISILTSSDKKFKIFTWAVFSNEGDYDNFGMIQARNETTEEYEIYRLWDRSDDVFSPQEAKLTDTSWFGAVYYELITTKNENITYYTLLGWDGKDIYSKRKIIEPITFKRNSGRPNFGASIFYKEKQLKRMIFEYAPTASFNLKWDNQYHKEGGVKKAKQKGMKKNKPFEVEEAKIERSQMILYDELEPMCDGLGMVKNLSVPSGKVVGLRFERGKWRKVENLIPRNSKRKNEIDVNNYNFNKEKRLY
ncbi:MAG: hypothetical protein J6Q96_05050 [Bacteroidales bacterium]|jgi:hypothetical protein|nr:hypothetical protein [Bacteroidales bacterium]MBQ2396338.1 hypothetical protein [Bacteroidales bacterium]MED9962107.1 hypothetical protein [Bacteroidales bacterium]MEE0267709.1 hypothetical protein [Bacteroidales bacterium]MEE0882462.1 hypothetical protein [Bacteroidales bacterium]